MKLWDSIEEYYGKMTKLINKTQNTADGNTDDKTPDEPSEEDQANALTTDSRVVANVLFSKTTPHIPALDLVLGDFYDTTQANSRAMAMRNKTREDKYTQAKKDNEIRRNRIAYKKALVSDTLDALKMKDK